MDVLKVARRLLSSGPLCEFCLGRPLADRSFGLGNDDRGRALRTSIALEDDVPHETTSPADCWMCEGITGRYDELADRAIEALAGTELYTYQVGTRIPPLVEENERLLRLEADLEPDAGEPLKSEVNREVGIRIGEQLGIEVDFTRPDVQLLVDMEADSVEVQRNSIAIYGRYRKLERDIPQTTWDKFDESVEELVSPPFLNAFRGTEAVFHGAGREDVDALMLGTGRPFVLEIKNPRRRFADLEELQAQATEHADGKVKLADLAFSSYEMVERVKELDASKTYRATVEFDEPVDAEALEDAVDALEGATIDQRTPHRVDHRRADLVRERQVLEIDAEIEDEYTVVLEIHGEGGLYIKELVHGDGGRTEPSLAGLLDVGATVTALDVVAVEGRDERFLEPQYRLDRTADPVYVPENVDSTDGESSTHAESGE